MTQEQYDNLILTLNNNHAEMLGDVKLIGISVIVLIVCYVLIQEVKLK